MRTLPTCLVVVLVMVGSASAQFTYDFPASATNGIGWAVCSAGDINDDGFADIIAGGSSSGVVRVFSGYDGTLLASPASPGSSFGYAVAGAGDLNGDGHDDYIVGRPDGNQAHVYSGADGSILNTIQGLSTGEFGKAVAGGGDATGDGVPDLIVAAPNLVDPLTSASGRIFVIDGATWAVHFSADGPPTSRLGWSVDFIGDVDGDGCDDVAFGCDPVSGIVGIVEIRSGASGTLIQSLLGTISGGEFGHSVRSCGDINQDGVPDIIVGEPKAQPLMNGSPLGAAYVYSGADWSCLFTKPGTMSLGQFGLSVAGGGDVDGDGFDDFAVADFLFGQGVLSIYSGLDGSYVDGWQSMGGSFGGGSSLAFAGDCDGNGTTDIVVGAPSSNAWASGSGRVVAFGLAAPLVPGPGQANSSNARLEVNGRDTATTTGPFVAPIARGNTFRMDFYGAPFAAFELYGCPNLNPGAWFFPGFGTFDLSLYPSFGDVTIILPGFAPVAIPLYVLDASGHSQHTFLVPPYVPHGSVLHIQALIQNAQPWTGPWSTLTAAHSLVVR